MDYAPIARIILRYLSGFTVGGAPLIAHATATDPLMIAAVGGIVGAVVEGFYTWAKKKGGKT